MSDGSFLREDSLWKGLSFLSCKVQNTLSFVFCSGDFQVCLKFLGGSVGEGII